MRNQSLSDSLFICTNYSTESEPGSIARDRSISASARAVSISSQQASTYRDQRLELLLQPRNPLLAISRASIDGEQRDLLERGLEILIHADASE